MRGSRSVTLLPPSVSVQHWTLERLGLLWRSVDFDLFLVSPYHLFISPVHLDFPSLRFRDFYTPFVPTRDCSWATAGTKLFDPIFNPRLILHPSVGNELANKTGVSVDIRGRLRATPHSTISITRRFTFFPQIKSGRLSPRLPFSNEPLTKWRSLVGLRLSFATSYRRSS
jgi:hypothetical protein